MKPSDYEVNKMFRGPDKALFMPGDKCPDVDKPTLIHYENNKMIVAKKGKGKSVENKTEKKAEKKTAEKK